MVRTVAGLCKVCEGVDVGAGLGHEGDGSDVAPQNSIRPETEQWYADVRVEPFLLVGMVASVRVASMITFVTGNDGKWNLAQDQMAPFGIGLVRATFDLPEIQSFDVEEIAAESVKLACAKVGGPVMVTDVGYALAALNGFPGPYARYTNSYLTPDDFLRLMEGKVDRSFVITEALAYCEPGLEPQVFVSRMQGVIAEVAHGTRLMDSITILEGFEKPLAAYGGDEVRAYWNTKLNHFTQLGEWLAAR